MVKNKLHLCVFFIISSCGTLVVAQDKQPFDTMTAFSAWKSVCSNAAQLPPYRLTGSSTTKYPSIKNLKGQSINWTSIIDGVKYRIEWSRDGLDKYAETYDGDTWYGFTKHRDDVGGGTVTKDPTKTRGQSPQEYIQKVAAGAWFPALSDVLDKPMNIGGKSLFDEYQSLEKHITTSVMNDQIVMTLNSKVAIDKHLPHAIHFLMLGEGLYPTKIKYLEKSDNIATELTTTISEYREFKGIYYPLHIRNIIQRPISGATYEVLCDQEITLELTAYKMLEDTLSYNFPNGTKVTDDRLQSDKRLYTIGVTDANQKSEMSYAGILMYGSGALFVIYFLNAIKKKRRDADKRSL